MDTPAATLGERFARALAAKDSGALCTLLADPLDFQALTPGRYWQAGTGRQAVEEIILAFWFGAGERDHRAVLGHPGPGARPRTGRLPGTRTPGRP
ncbi:MAG TPA: hypothetical protein VFX25_13970 [Streptosporangiaceae bacterium]|nr:hypothetical protein [Streptosporangiaceae bacterium]